MKSPVATPVNKVGSNRRSRVVRWLCVVLLLGWLGVQWWYQPPPTVGGSQAPSAAARRELQKVYASVPAEDESGFERLDPARPTGWMLSFAEPLQSLPTYQQQNPTRPTPARRTIVIQPVGELNAEQQRTIKQMREYAAAFFQLPVRVSSPIPLPDASRGQGTAAQAGGKQYRSGAILEALKKRLPPDAAAYFAIVGVDLYTEGLNYIFGQGDFAERVGVYSLVRYFPEFWKKKRRLGDERLALRRSCQVLNHEVGHVMGMWHCVFYRCSMNGANTLGDADAAPLDYCPVCHRKLLWNLGINGTKRYSDLLKFYRTHDLPNEASWVQGRLERWKKIAKQEGLQ
jgi:archaemetzincin